jgi:lysozyme family protein
MAQQCVTALGVAVTVDEHVGPSTIAAINAVDADSLMSELVLLSTQHYTEVAAVEHASPDELQS